MLTIKIEDRVDGITEWLERWVLSRLSPLGVVRKDSATTTLVPKFEQGDNSKDLPLGPDRHGVPLCLWGKINRWMCGTSEGLRPWEHKVGLHTVSNESKHGNTAVLDFGLTKPSDGGFVSLGPEVGISKVLEE
jgi:hypothetical protein